MLYVVGHQNPDTDSFCAAVAMQKFLEFQGKDAQAAALGIPGNEATFVFREAGLPVPKLVEHLPEGSELVLVDHNEASQSVPGRENMKIKAVYDHHKIGHLETEEAITMRVDPVGCTCTILYEEFQHAGFEPSKELAMLMCGAIISDTLMLTSPTTTERDKEALEALGEIAEIDDLDDWSMQMFKAKSDLSRMTDKDIIRADYKRYEYGDYSVVIAVIETTNPEHAFDRKEGLLEGIEKVKKKDRVDYLLLCVVDVINKQNTAFVSSDDEEKLLHAAFGIKTENQEADLGDRVSRKKQMVPPITEYFGADVKKD